MLEEITGNGNAVAIVAGFTAVGAVLDTILYVFLGATAMTIIKKKFFKKG